MNVGHGLVCCVTEAVHAGAPPAIVAWWEPEDPRESGFMLWAADDSSDPDDYADGRGLVTLCLHCLIDKHPEAGRGLDLAREHGAAFLEDGEWVVGDGEWAA